ncbi:hypothetical protein, partial [Pantoea sp. PA1]
VNLQHAGETGNMKKNQPALLTEGCIKYWGQVKTMKSVLRDWRQGRSYSPGLRFPQLSWLMDNGST